MRVCFLSTSSREIDPRIVALDDVGKVSKEIFLVEFNRFAFIDDR